MFSQKLRSRIAVILLLSTIFLIILTVWDDSTASAETPRRTLFWGSRGGDVWLLQRRLIAWGYFAGPADGVYGGRTFTAVRAFQRRNGLFADGVVGASTWRALGYGARAAATAVRGVRGVSVSNDVNLIAHLIQGESANEPYIGQVSVGAVIMNRLKSPKFPHTVAGVVYQPLAFESVSNGRYNLPPSAENYRAARDAVNGWDPTYGCTFFWNPAKRVSPWIWTRQIIVKYGGHVFGR